ncbi:MAG: FkbM family methyltransferase, partial [Alphaproteobacteria bacterium]
MVIEAGSPFYHYYATFDAIAVMRSHAARDLKSSAQHLTNYVGVKIDPKFLPHILEPMRGKIEPLPIPANWHADIAEWAGALRAVDVARNSFTVVELGCGWGCWLNITGTAARNRGLKPRLIGIEGDKGHIQFAREACEVNGFRDDEVILHHGVAAASGGVALFPLQDAAGENWGLAPVFDATDLQRKALKLLGKYVELPMISLKEIVNSVDRVDLLHIDIQGGEADLMEACIADLSKKVAYTVIGTHSRQIEGRLFETMLNAGWRLEIERTAHFINRDNNPVVSVDGVQGWRNPLLAQ